MCSPSWSPSGLCPLTLLSSYSESSQTDATLSSSARCNASLLVCLCRCLLNAQGTYKWWIRFANHLICLDYLFYLGNATQDKKKTNNFYANLLSIFLKISSEPLFSALSRILREGDTGSSLPRAARGGLTPLPASSWARGGRVCTFYDVTWDKRGWMMRVIGRPLLQITIKARLAVVNSRVKPLGWPPCRFYFKQHFSADATIYRKYIFLNFFVYEKIILKSSILTLALVWQFQYCPKRPDLPIHKVHLSCLEPSKYIQYTLWEKIY